MKAFSPDDLLELVLVCFNEDLEKIVAPGPLNKRALDLVRWADHRGIVPDLARGAFLARPRDTTLRELQDVYEGAPRLSIQTAGAARRVTASALEAIVRPRLKSVDMDVWRERYASVEGQVCRIEIDGAAKGTGFLIGPDLVLTNFHVIEAVIAEPSRAPSVIFRFDYKRLTDGAVLQGATSRCSGKTVGLSTQQNIRGSRSKAAQTTPFRPPTSSIPRRSASRPRSVPRRAAQEPPRRGRRNGAGSISRTPSLRCRRARRSSIAQHPQGEPIKLAMDMDAVLSLNSNGTRVRYATNTEPGSSGSPCFDMDWTLVALHHMGDPAWRNPQYNEGVPIGLIRTRLAERGVLYGA